MNKCWFSIKIWNCYFQVGKWFIQIITDNPEREQRYKTVKLSHKSAEEFWRVWNENGETHKHGFYESTWMAIRAALRA